MLHSPQDLEYIRAGAKKLSGVLHEVVKKAVVGATGSEMNVLAEDLIKKAGGVPAFKGYGSPPYGYTLCVSANSCVVHGIPTDEPFKEGDIIGLDLGMVYNGFYSDMARTVALAPLTDQELEMIAVTQEALDTALRMVKPGVYSGDIGSAVQKLIESHGFGVVRDLAGHGLGKKLHEQPELPNFGSPGQGTVLEEGMILAFEPMVTMGDWRVRVADDHWSVVTRDGLKTAHIEDMVEVTASGHRILTR